MSMFSNLSTKKFSLWLIIGLLLSWLLSCSPKPSNSNELEFWTMQLQPQFTEYFTQLNNKFETNNQTVKVNWVDIPWSAMESKILTAISSKTAPDLVNLNPNFASQLATRNAWLNLDEVVPPNVKKSYLPKIWQASTIETCQENNCSETSFGIPWYLTTRITIYNQDLLSKAGRKQPPTTYEELAQVARQIKDKTGKYALFMTFVPEDSGEVLESLVQMGVNLVDEQGKAAFNTPAGVAAFRYWVDLYQQGLLPPEVLTQGHRHGIELYQAGETALLSSGAEFLNAIATNAPTIAQVSAAAPQITGKTGKKNVAVMNLVIPRDTDKPEEALKYALYVTNTENQLAFAKQANVLPSTEEAVKQYIQELSSQQTNNSVEQAKKVSAMQLKDAEVLIPAMKNIKLLQQSIYENLQAAMLKEKTVEQAVEDAAAQWNQQQ
ncbi:carbohydrate ABC transporter substrate-binding protein, CUT1 family [Stanieria cyanosphaera PCC 7437]|uniref:Carbohydrate ABC transporter substrate-binding protein, CUT1 family n=1 Tax=Stanieria cyanosphaera (strain ATCC 29371 / PCC 7437) TaxID=111780 RepID=K9XYS3_STAC7|nr:carbohydrate ABC transporter substrate-binding protein, CUT1 family [Stanieria cyanosphaera PCC 7437]